MSAGDADPRDIVRTGYDRVSRAYRADDFRYDGSGYQRWLSRLEVRLQPGARVLDLGCGCGVPVSQRLAASYQVTGVDLSPIQIARARALVPGARFQAVDMTTMEFEAGSFDAVVALFSIIHVPVADQPGLIGRIATWLEPNGWLLATVARDAWTGTEADWRGVAGATMYWSSPDVATSRTWMREAGLSIEEEHAHTDSDGSNFVQMLARLKCAASSASPRRCAVARGCCASWAGYAEERRVPL